MADRSRMAMRVLERLRTLRLEAGIPADQLCEELILGPGWIERFESGETLPDIDTLFVILDRINVDPSVLFANLRDEAEETSGVEMSRTIRGEQVGKDLLIHFQYANHDAVYTLQDASLEEFEQVLKILRDRLAQLAHSAGGGSDEKAIKTAATTSAFLKAIQTWPRANPSDLWWFVIYRAFCDPYNHPAEFARMSFEQSWKRTGGWALEEILVRHYGPELRKHGISIEIPKASRKRMLLSQLAVQSRQESDKVDVLLVGPGDVCFGVVHVKASFAERRTDDVPMSQELIRHGYCSPLWTMDCKSSPAARPVNRGELGQVTANRSAKRKDIEDDALFSACFSYNQNTQPTPREAEVAARIYCCDLSDPDDDFTAFVVDAWKHFTQPEKAAR